MPKAKDKLTEDEQMLLEAIDSRLIKGILQIALLRVVQRGYTYGYDILKHMHKKQEVFREDAGIRHPKVSAGLLYTALNNLEKKGYLTSRWKHSKGSPSKRNYALTPKGKRFLRIAKERIRTILSALFEKSGNQTL